MSSNRLWYAIQHGADDSEWGNGSFDLIEAKKMAEHYECDQIAVIDGGYNDDGEPTKDPICIDILKKGKDF